MPISILGMKPVTNIIVELENYDIFLLYIVSISLVFAFNCSLFGQRDLWDLFLIADLWEKSYQD